MVCRRGSDRERHHSHGPAPLRRWWADAAAAGSATPATPTRPGPRRARCPAQSTRTAPPPPETRWPARHPGGVGGGSWRCRFSAARGVQIESQVRIECRCSPRLTSRFNLGGILKRIVVLLAALFVAGAAFAQQYPNRAVRMVIPWPPGQATDLV